MNDVQLPIFGYCLSARKEKKNSNLMCFNLTVAISIRVGPATSTALNTLVGVKREDRSEIEEDML